MFFEGARFKSAGADRMPSEDMAAGLDTDAPYGSDATPDVQAMVKKIRTFTAEQQSLTPEERRSVVRRRIAEVRDIVRSRYEGLSEILIQLKNRIETSSDVSFENLHTFVRERARDLALTTEQIKALESALKTFQNKHNTVERFRKDFPSDADLFETSLGFRPKGKIEVIKRPMCFYFRCFDRRDFARIYFSNLATKKSHEPTIEEIKTVEEIEGLALQRAFDPRLEGTLMIENTANILNEQEQVFERETSIVKESPFSVPIEAQAEDLTVTLGSREIGKILITERVDGSPSRLQIVDAGGEVEKKLFDVRRMFKRRDGNFVLESPDLPSSEANEIDRSGVILETSDGKPLCQIDLTGEEIRFDNLSANDIRVSHTVQKYVRKPNEEASRRTMIHEEQHQINKLFKMVEFEGALSGLYIRSLEQAKTLRHLCDSFMRGAIDRHRQIAIDEKTREEITAFYSEAEPLDSIYKKIAPPIYDFASDSVIQKVQNSIIQEFEKNSAGDSLLEEKFGVGAAASAVNILKDNVRHEIERSFRDEYREDLSQWLDVIKRLEETGLSREKILGRLMQEPVSAWKNMARQLIGRKGSI